MIVGRFGSRSRSRSRLRDAAPAGRWGVRILGAVVMGFALAVVASACGETRRPLGDECLRDDDCLSSACSGRVCVATPPLTSDQLGSPDRGAKLPDATSNLPQEAGAPFGG